MKYFLSVSAAVILFFATAAAIGPDRLDQIILNHEQRIATQEEMGRRNELQIAELDHWYDNRINKMEKYYDSKIAKHDQIDTELKALLEFLKSTGAVSVAIISIIFGYLGIRKALRNKNNV